MQVRSRAFSLLEMLVVISLITLLISLLLPNLYRAKEQTMRTRCASNMRQVIVALTTIADGNTSKLPSGKRNNVGGIAGEHCIWISNQLHDQIATHLGGQAGTTWRNDGPYGFFECPNFKEGFGYNNQYGWVIGYNYLGNHPRMNELNNFQSPIHVTDDPALPVWVDLNNYTPGGWSFVPHTSAGALNMGAGPNYYNIDTAGATPQANGSEGGNVGRLDTSVIWKPIAEMEEYETGEFGFGKYPSLW